MNNITFFLICILSVVEFYSLHIFFSRVKCPKCGSRNTLIRKSWGVSEEARKYFVGLICGKCGEETIMRKNK